MLEKQTITGKIEILSDGQIQIREDTIIMEDGRELSRMYRRYALAPGDALPEQIDSRIQAVTTTLWTPSVVIEFQTAQKAILASTVNAVAEVVTPAVVVK